MAHFFAFLYVLSFSFNKTLSAETDLYYLDEGRLCHNLDFQQIRFINDFLFFIYSDGLNNKIA